MASEGKATLGQRLAGICILVHLGFLGLANLLEWLPPFRVIQDPQVFQTISIPTRFYASWTRQYQGWTQYAPYIPHQCVFVATKMHWQAKHNRPTQTILSDFEPADPETFVRPFLSHRLACFEWWLARIYLGWDREEAQQRPLVWQEQLQAHFQSHAQHLWNYMRWQHERLRKQDPLTPIPDEIVLNVRIYRISPPQERPWKWSGPEELPMLRWRNTSKPDFPAQPDFYWYDPLEAKFKPLNREPKEKPMDGPIGLNDS